MPNITTTGGDSIEAPPAPNKVRLFYPDGSARYHWPIDAKEILRLGHGSTVPYKVEPITAEPETVEDEIISPLLDLVVELDSMTKAELMEHAESVGVEVKPAMNKAEIVEAIKEGAE